MEEIKIKINLLKELDLKGEISEEEIIELRNLIKKEKEFNLED